MLDCVGMNCSFATTLDPLNIIRMTKGTKKTRVPMDTITVSTARKHKFPLLRAFPKRFRVCSPARDRFFVGHLSYPKITSHTPSSWWSHTTLDDYRDQSRSSMSSVIRSPYWHILLTRVTKVSYVYQRSSKTHGIQFYPCIQCTRSSSYCKNASLSSHPVD